MATSEDEHAVSITTAGPCTPKKYDNRPAAKFGAFPNGMYVVKASINGSTMKTKLMLVK